MSIIAELPPWYMNSDPFILNTGTRFLNKVAQKDARGKDILNSAKQPFDPPVEYPFPISTFSIQRKEYRNPLNNRDDFIHRVNSTVLWGKFQPWQALIENITVSENRMLQTIENTPRVWDVTYEIAVNTDTYGWKTVLLDQGMKSLVKKPGTQSGEEILVPTKDDDGGIVSSPSMLDGHGWKNPKDSPPVYEWADGSPFELYGSKDFTALNVPNPYA